MSASSFPLRASSQPHRPRDLSNPATERHRRLPADSCFSEGQPPPRAILRASRLMGKERSVRGARPMRGAVHLPYTWNQFPCVRPPDRPFVMRPLTHPTARGPVDNFTLSPYLYPPSFPCSAHHQRILYTRKSFAQGTPPRDRRLACLVVLIHVFWRAARVRRII